jgi:hypothetical protein
MLALAPAARSAKPRDLRHDLKLPVIVAPMFLISGPALVVAAAKAGVIAAFPAANARTVADLERWMASIEDQLAAAKSPRQWGVGLIVHRSYDRFADDLALAREYRPRLVITALGDPRRVIDPVHAYGGEVFCDVVSVAQARKAAAAGVDGLVLVTAGAGGHTGTLNPFAFVDEVRRFWPGQIALSGAIANGRGTHSGFKGMQISHTSLVVACRQLAGASSIHTLPTEQYNQDIVSLGYHAALGASESIERLSDALAILTLALCKAVNLRGAGEDVQLGVGTERLYAMVRELSPAIGADRAMDVDVRAISHAIRNGPFELLSGRESRPALASASAA